MSTEVTVPLRLPNDAVVKVQVTNTESGELEVSGSTIDTIFEHKEIGGAIEGIGQLVLNAMTKLAPQKGSVEFALEVGLENGKLIALWVKGTGKASIKVTLEWTKG